MRLLLEATAAGPFWVLQLKSTLAQGADRRAATVQRPDKQGLHSSTLQLVKVQQSRHFFTLGVYL